MKNKYRIIRDDFAGYEVQIKRWWLPFWYQCNWVNTQTTIEEAERFIEEHKRGGVKVYD